MAFCFSSDLEILDFRGCTAHQLPGILDFLSLPILLTFSALFMSKYINLRFQMTLQFLEQFAIFFSVTAFFVAVSIHLPLYLKFANWAIYAVSLFAAWFSNKSSGVFFCRS
ncbi:hypothetical protein TorRG33x02_022810 [Trema orientale]|uniref:Uncharacterized protein n=1 Tax=Trema orientale TaxID=63057 RepID=A0A2P5FW30_TREOI|nr:hypothetical protein TorRG33x02_022810 [Trema orientale]